MDWSEFISSDNVDLTNCDREAIHIPGATQPHGILFVLSEPALKIAQVSHNVEQMLGIMAATLLGQPLATLLDDKQITAIHDCLQREFDQPNPLKLAVQAANGQAAFNGIIHRSTSNHVILELEPLDTEENGGFLSFYQLTIATLDRIQRSANLSELSTLIAEEIRRITGFDRVMVYRFAADDSGEVIAEAKQDELEPFLGLHYPHTDIPKQARRLYLLNPLRLIPDVNYEPVAIVGEEAEAAGGGGGTETRGHGDTEAGGAEGGAEGAGEVIQNSKLSAHRKAEASYSPQPSLKTQNSSLKILPLPPLDLSFSVLRSVSPIHLEYLKNMEVGASMSISLLKDNQLWGLIACHHETPRFVPYEIRTACEFLGRVMSLELASKENNEHLDQKMQVKSMQTQFIDGVVRWHSPSPGSSPDFVEGLLHDRPNLLKMVGSEGAAICTDQSIVTIGKTPTEAQIQALLEWLDGQFENYLFSTDALPTLYPAAMAFKDSASGLLALSIARIQKNYVLWFRPEVLQYVTWAGNPQKPARVEADGSLFLSPRQSFAEWQETVRLKSLPWQSYEVEGAIELRSAIVGIVLRKADELAALNVELERSNTELDAFAYVASHDLKEPLRGIHNYATFLLEDYGTVLDADGVDKLQTLVHLSRRMERLIETLLHFSRLGRQELNRKWIDLNELVQNVADVLVMSREWHVDIRIPRPLPRVQGDRVLLEEVLINLISNGFKYNDRADKWVEVGFIEGSRESGVGSREFGAGEAGEAGEAGGDGETRGHEDSHPSASTQNSKLKTQHTPPTPHSPLPTPHIPHTFYVRDNGIGIREHHLETIFRIFKRLHEPEKYGGGTGAGLTIVKKLSSDMAAPSG